MSTYILSLAVGLLVGVIYSLLDVRSPAPPVVALVGLFGILIGEQLPPLAKRVLAGHPVTAAWARSECVPHVFGALPMAASKSAAQKAPVPSPAEPPLG